MPIDVSELVIAEGLPLPCVPYDVVSLLRESQTWDDLGRQPYWPAVRIYWRQDGGLVPLSHEDGEYHCLHLASSCLREHRGSQLPQPHSMINIKLITRQIIRSGTKDFGPPGEDRWESFLDREDIQLAGISTRAQVNILVV